MSERDKLSHVSPDTPMTAALSPDEYEIVVEQRDRGGQHVGTFSSAITLRHRPTGIAITVNEARSQYQNRKIAERKLVELVRLAASGSPSRDDDSAALKAALAWAMEYIEDGLPDEVPVHACGYVLRPDLGTCVFHDQWTKAKALLGYFDAKPGASSLPSSDGGNQHGH